MTMCIFQLLLLPMIMAPGFSWIIKTNVDGISPGETKDFQLECTQEQPAVFKSVYSILIRKREGNYILGEIDVYRNIAKKISTNNNLKVDGNARTGSLAFLKLTWSQVSQEEIGTYECQVSGFTQQNGFKTISVPSKSISISIKKAKLYTEEEVNEIRQNLQSQVNVLKYALSLCQGAGHGTTPYPTWTWATTLTPSTNRPTTRPVIRTTRPVIRTTRPVIRTTQKTTSAIITTNPTTPKSGATTPKSGATAWPRGSYWLPKPATGCPNVHASSTSNRVKTVDPSAPELRFWLNVENRKLEQCEMSINANSLKDRLADSWPEGNYCIGTDTTCRIHFRPGSIEYMYRDSPSCANPKYVNRAFNLNLCCKESGSAYTPIKLPTDKPFYLYRHKSACQQVEGMDVQTVKTTYSWKTCTEFISKKGKGSRWARSTVYLCHYQPSAGNNNGK